MSSTSSYPTENTFNGSGDSAAKMESYINEGYAAINDIGLKRKRPLPMPPAFKPLRPKKNLTLCCQSCKRFCSYCVGSRLILSIPLLVLTLAALGVVTYLLVTNREVPIPTTIDPPTTMPPPDDGVPEGSIGSLKFDMSPVQNTKVLNLLQESNGQNVTILQNVNLTFTNGTWSLDGREISIWISHIDKGNFQIVLNINISNSQCRHAGKYFVVLSDSNGKAEQSLLYKVKAACPCESEYELNSNKALECKLKVVGSTTVSFDKVSGENKKSILYQTGIRIPDNVQERGRFSAKWERSGTLNTRINFSPVQCYDEGNYSLTVTSRMGTKVHYTHVKVIDYPSDPTLTILSGLIQGKENVLQCQASTGCTNASLTVEATAQKGKDYIAWGTNLTSRYYQEGYIWKANVTLILTEYMVNLNFLQDRCFRCTYSTGGNHKYSQPICIKIIPADFCTKRKPKCQYSHPYDCNKYITCTTEPKEGTCQPGLHYRSNSDNCTGECVYPAQTNCNIGRFDGCNCGVT